MYTQEQIAQMTVEQLRAIFTEQQVSAADAPLVIPTKEQLLKLKQSAGEAGLLAIKKEAANIPGFIDELLKDPEPAKTFLEAHGLSKNMAAVIVLAASIIGPIISAAVQSLLK